MSAAASAVALVPTVATPLFLGALAVALWRNSESRSS